MPNGCRCLHLVCLLCILGAPVQPARGERAPGLGSRPCPAVPRLHVDLCRPETALQPLRWVGEIQIVSFNRMSLFCPRAKRTQLLGLRIVSGDLYLREPNPDFGLTFLTSISCSR